MAGKEEASAAPSLEQDAAAWNDAMYRKHPTPYGRSIAGAISDARVRTVKRMSQVTPTDKVLEIGCESGHLLLQIPECALRMGADISQAALDDARRAADRVGARNVEFRQLNAEQPLPFSPGDFDVIIISEMLEHVERPRTVLEQVRVICTPETRLVITVPNEKPKLVIKDILRALRLFDLLFPGIEEGQSEWHLQQFSKPMIRETVKGLYDVRMLESIWGAHFAALLAAAPMPGRA